MIKWIIEQTELFENKFQKLIPRNIQPEVKKQILKLAENPFNSKPLGNKFFREKKIKKWRIYFLVYQDKLVICFVDLSDKKTQQKIINEVKLKFKFLKEIINEKYKCN